MTNEHFFKTQLHVHFTREELSVIMSALAEYYLSELREHHDCLASQSWSIREKVQEFCKIYDNSPLL